MNRSVAGDALRGAARSSVLSFAGALMSGLAGFVLSVLLGRGLGPLGSGYVFQMISVFTIATAIAKLGLDTTSVWLLPRLAIDERDGVRPAVRRLLLGSAAGGVAAGAAIALYAPFLDGGHEDLRTMLLVSAAFMPLAAVSTVALAVTRGLGGIRPYVLIGSIGLPGFRVAGVAVALALGAGAVTVGITWLGVLALITVLALVWAQRSVRAFPSSSSAPGRDLTGRITRFSLPRAASSVVEQALLWQDVLIVGLLVGPAAAGVYAVVTRLVQAGFIPSTSMRIVVSPEFSRMVHQDRRAELTEFYTRTAQWIVLMSAPMFLVFGILGQPILSIFGPGFEQGYTALIVASLGGLLWSSAGNVQSLLLMAGGSGRAAMNKAVVLVVSLSLLFTLVPMWGIVGAATAWTLSMTLDAVLALIQVRRMIGVTMGAKAIMSAVGCSVVCTAVPAVAARLLLGDTYAALAVGTISAGCVLAVTLFVSRKRFALEHAVAVFTRGRRRA